MQAEDFDIGAEFAALCEGRTDIGGIGCFVGTVQPGLTPIPPPSAPRSVDTTPPARSPAGQVTSTPQGPGVTSGGTNSYQTITTPGGGSAIVVPNGNGTSTIIHSDGRIETVPTPR